MVKSNGFLLLFEENYFLSLYPSLSLPVPHPPFDWWWFTAIMGFRECNWIMCWQLEEDRMEAIRCGGNWTTMQKIQQGYTIIGQIDSVMAAFHLYWENATEFSHLTACHYRTTEYSYQRSALAGAHEIHRGMINCDIRIKYLLENMPHLIWTILSVDAAIL